MGLPYIMLSVMVLLKQCPLSDAVFPCVVIQHHRGCKKDLSRNVMI